MSSTPKNATLYTMLKWSIGLFCTFVVVGGLVLWLIVLLAEPNLPSLDVVIDYRPKIPLRVYTSDNFQIGEFGEEHREFMPIGEIPNIQKKALLAIVENRLSPQGGVDFAGCVRAVFADLRGEFSQEASTITMQVARNFYLSKEKTYLRKLYEVMLALKIERALTKDKILELYMNQIYLGEGAYGFASAAQVYFGKSIKDLTVGEVAMLAGLPDAPSTFNPIENPDRARQRQLYILQRMLDHGYITRTQYSEAIQEVTIYLQPNDRRNFNTHAEYVAETVRQLLFAQYKEALYASGLSVYTTITKSDQDSAYAAARQGAIDYDRRRGYRGPEATIDLPKNKAERAQAIADAFAKYPNSDNLESAIVISVARGALRVQIRSGKLVEITGDGLKFADSAISPKTPTQDQIKVGAVIRIQHDAGGQWSIAQLPDVACAFVALNSQDGSVRAMVGGFDFNLNKFDHVNQAWRQPGSSFKPFVYSAALERGFSPATVINDAPLLISAAETGSQDWQPQNDDGVFDGPITMRTALSKSKNVASVRILHEIGPQYVQNYIGKFGFDRAKNPAHLAMALGTGLVTPFQEAGAYAVFSNGGYRINPYLIAKIVDATGKVIFEAKPVQAGQGGARVIDARNAFVVDTMLRTVARFGSGAQASKQLERMDVAGKTGTASDAMDGWFAGYVGNIVGVAWMGYDAPKSLGSREFGATLALPIWINYMKDALKGKPEVNRPTPPGVALVNDDWMYSENVDHGGISALGFDETGKLSDTAEANSPIHPASPEQAKQRILDLLGVKK